MCSRSFGTIRRAERPTVGRRRRVPLVAFAGRHQRDAERHDLPGLNHRPGVARQSRELVVFGTVVGDQQRQLALARRPHADLEVPAEDPDADRIELPFHDRLLEPGRRAIAGGGQHRLLPERPAGTIRIARIAHDHRRAVVVAQLELVLKPRESVVGQMEHPTAILADEVGIAERQVGAQPDPAKRSSGSATRRVPNTAPTVADSVPTAR